MLNENLIKLRKKTNKTQYDIAKLLNISRATYGSYEQGTRTPAPEMLVKLSNLYKVSVDYLLDKDVNTLAYNNVNDNKISIMSRNGTTEEIILSDEDLETAKVILKALKEKNKTEPKDF